MTGASRQDGPDRQPTLFLHVGLPKTATTYLQTAVFPHLRGPLYFDTPTDPAFDDPDDLATGSRIMSCVLKRDPRYWDSQGDAFLTSLLGPRQNWTPRDVLISDEGMGRAGSRPGLLGDHLRAMGAVAAGWGLSRLAVICTVRRQDHWFASHYSQMSDRNPRASQRDFDRAARDLIRPTGGRFKLGMLLDYATLHAALANAAGAGNVLLFPFERQRSDADGVMADLLGFLGAEMAAGAAPERGAAGDGVNVRALGADRWSIRPEEGRHGPRSLRLTRLAHLPGRVSRSRRGRSFVLSPETGAAILDSYRDANMALSDDLGLDLGSYGYF